MSLKRYSSFLMMSISIIKGCSSTGVVSSVCVDLELTCLNFLVVVVVTVVLQLTTSTGIGDSVDAGDGIDIVIFAGIVGIGIFAGIIGPGIGEGGGFGDEDGGSIVDGDGSGIVDGEGGDTGEIRLGVSN